MVTGLVLCRDCQCRHCHVFGFRVHGCISPHAPSRNTLGVPQRPAWAVGQEHFCPCPSAVVTEPRSPPLRERARVAAGSVFPFQGGLLESRGQLVLQERTVTRAVFIHVLMVQESEMHFTLNPSLLRGHRSSRISGGAVGGGPGPRSSCSGAKTPSQTRAFPKPVSTQTLLPSL